MKIAKRIIPEFLTGILFLSILACSSGKKINDRSGKDENPANFGRRYYISVDSLKKNFANPGMIYAPFIFWFWDEPLDEAKMADMSKVICSQGFNPGYAHARRSMVGTPGLPGEEWLGDKWFNSFEAALNEAEKQHKYLGYCDEYWWPSFQAHGRVLEKYPELKAESLNYQVIDTHGGTQVMVPSSFFAVAAQLAGEGKPDSATIQSKTLKIIGTGEPFNWNVPAKGEWRIFVFNKQITKGIDGGAVNVIDKRLAKAFIGIALEPYAKLFDKKLGSSIPGDFIDHEGDYGRKLAWSETLDSCFREKYKSDCRLIMPLMLSKDVEGQFVKVRWEWFDMVTDLYAANFQEVTNWHEKRGMYTTTHVWEESIPLQVNAVGDHMKLLRSVTMPGQDCLGQKALQVHDFKEIQSVAEFGDTRAATELLGAGIFGVMGSAGSKGKPWETFTPSFLKKSINAVTAWGMSHIIPHGIFTTRKLTGNPWPPDWYSESPMFSFMHLWTDFARRASFVNSMGHAVPDVLLYNPMESAWINANAAILDENSPQNPVDKTDAGRIKSIDKTYSEVINELTNARIEFLVGDRYYLKKMNVHRGRLNYGTFSFKTIVLPEIEILTLETAKKIIDFAKSGGKVYALGRLPSASADNGMNDPKMRRLMNRLERMPSFTSCAGTLGTIIGKPESGLESKIQFSHGSFPMLQEHRLIDGRDFFWLVNNNPEEQECEVSIMDVRGAASKWDCETGEICSVSSVDSEAGTKLKLQFKPLEAFWLVFDPGLPAVTVPEKPELGAVMTIIGNWKVTYDAAIQPVMEFPFIPPKIFTAGVDKPLEDWSAWGMQKFSGLIDYYKMVVVDKPEEKMFLDLGKVCHSAEVWVNGKSVGVRLWGPYIFELTGSVKQGQNAIKIRVANLINNSYDDIQESGLVGPVRILSLAE